MSRADNCLYWQAIFRLMAGQDHCHSLIMACTTLSDTSMLFVRVCRKHVLCTDTYITCKCANDWNWLCCLYRFILWRRPIIPNRRWGWGLFRQFLRVDITHPLSFKSGSLPSACMLVQKIWRKLEQSPLWTANLKQELWCSAAAAPTTPCATCLAAYGYFFYPLLKSIRADIFSLFHHLQV